MANKNYITKLYNIVFQFHRDITISRKIVTILRLRTIKTNIEFLKKKKKVWIKKNSSFFSPHSIPRYLCFFQNLNARGTLSRVGIIFNFERQVIFLIDRCANFFFFFYLLFHRFKHVNLSSCWSTRFLFFLFFTIGQIFLTIHLFGGITKIYNSLFLIRLGNYIQRKITRTKSSGLESKGNDFIIARRYPPLVSFPFQ